MSILFFTFLFALVGNPTFGAGLILVAVLAFNFGWFFIALRIGVFVYHKTKKYLIYQSN